MQKKDREKAMQKRKSPQPRHSSVSQEDYSDE
jgi:hypothetical protein